MIPVEMHDTQGNRSPCMLHGILSLLVLLHVIVTWLSMSSLVGLLHLAI